MRYDPLWIRKQSDDVLMHEIVNLSDFNVEMGTSWPDRVDAVNQIARELLGMRNQRRLVEEHGWPVQKPRLVK